jgi:hypothetical protein
MGLAGCNDSGTGDSAEGSGAHDAVATRADSLESSVTLNVTQDTSIRLSAPNKNFGSSSELDVNRALVKLEPAELASVLRPGDYVVSARLELSLVDRATRRLSLPRQVGAHRVLKPWTEAGATWLCAIDTTPSNTRPDCANSSWAQLGSDAFEPSASSTTIIPASRSGVISFDVSRDVRGFSAGTLVNQGWILKTPLGAILEVADLASAESATPPRLVLNVRSCSAAACDDHNACTVDSCSALAECVNTPSTGAACDDGNVCTQGEQCVQGACAPGMPLAEGSACGGRQVCSGNAAQCVAASIVVNEVESSGGSPGDWVELYNAGTTLVDVSGYRFKDGDDSHTFYSLPAGSLLAPGAYLVLEESQFGFGLGAADSARLYAPSVDSPIDSYAWTAHAALTYGRCPDGTGAFGATTVVSKGGANDCTPPVVVDAGTDSGSDAGVDAGAGFDASIDAGAASVVVNEVESNGGTPGDWVELYNPGASAIDVSGYRFKDGDDTHSFYFIPAGTSIAPNGYLLLEEAQFGFGLGSADSARLYPPSGDSVVDSYTWTAHAPVSYGRCANGSGSFSANATSTKGATNDCAAPMDGGSDGGSAGNDAGSAFAPWPGTNSVRTSDAIGTFTSNLSGLTYQPAGESAPILWAVTNGPSRLYRLEYDGALWLPAAVDGWDLGKTLVYPAGAGGPDSEGVTKAEWNAPGIYVATERDNNANSVSRLSILRFDTSASGSTLVATHEWNLTADLPVVGPNLGLEAITWIPDSYLVGAGFRDQARAASYDPSLYPDHGNGVFFVGVEASGMIYAYVLDHATGAFQRVADIASGQAGAMDLEFDRDRSTLWSYCDDTCGNRSSLLSVNSDVLSASFGSFVLRALIDRPSSLANINNEGIAIAPESECVAGFKSFFWSDDSDTDGHSLRSDAIPCAPLF